MTDPDAPTVIALWDRTHTARKARECQMCHETIEAGQRYQSTGMLVDGAFEHWVRHEYGERYPSGCPKYRERDRAEAEAQFRKDEAASNPIAEESDRTRVVVVQGRQALATYRESVK